MNRSRSVLLFVLALMLPLLSATTAQADESFDSTGPVEMLWVGNDLACQVSYQAGDTFEFFPPKVLPGDCGVMLSVDGDLYAPDFAAHDGTATGKLDNFSPFTPVSESSTGSGTTADPFTITTTASAGGLVAVTQTVTYVTGRSSFTLKLTLRGETDAVRRTRVYFAGDCYASGSDIGYGFRRPEIRSFGCAQNPDNSPAARTIQLLPSSPGSTGVEDRFWRVWERIGNQEQLDNTCLCSESVDNGVALSWDDTLDGPAAHAHSLDVAFTESTPAAPPADSDGDTLPDSWETGSAPAGDAENLAALGADPAQKDIFVHADWMEGCQPPAGWETRAIDLFAAHGIRLHVDSGPGSLNYDKRPWGDRSRSGAVAATDVLPLTNWAAVDTYKDRYFIPSKRRRAFHYVLFAKQVDDGGGPAFQGSSRGIPDSDLVIGNCGSKVRASTSYFVHELGHNLGLRHGGFEHMNFKPNYHSIMNYSWAWWALSDDRNFLGYSDQQRPDIDENRIDEHAGWQGPVSWWCPKGRDKWQQNVALAGGVRTNLDVDCDGRYGERSVSTPVDQDSSALHVLVGFNDWAALKFTGAGVLGALDLPPRQDAPPDGELTEAEIQRAVAERQQTVQAARRVLRLQSRTSSLRFSRKRKRVITVSVSDGNGRTLKGVSLRVKGAVLVDRRRRGRAPKRVRSDKRGNGRLRLRLTSRRELQVIADKRGFQRATLMVPVTR